MSNTNRENGYYHIKLSETPFKWTIAEYIGGSENAWIIPGQYGYLYEHENVNEWKDISFVNEERILNPDEKH